MHLFLHVYKPIVCEKLNAEKISPWDVHVTAAC